MQLTASTLVSTALYEKLSHAGATAMGQMIVAEHRCELNYDLLFEHEIVDLPQ